jgi:hypothetical protein
MSLSVKFVNRSIGATVFLWSFGDGATSTLENPTHSYAAAGAYVVTLQASVGSGGRSYATRVVYPADALSDVVLGSAVGDTLADAGGDIIAVPPPT